MSMTSELVQELRLLAKSHCFYGSGCTLEMAAKTIEELSEKLSAENMERSSAYYNGGWIPVSERMPEKPTKNPEFDNKPLELYLVSVKNTKYPFRAFWNGENFTDGWCKVNATAWIPLPEPYKVK